MLEIHPQAQHLLQISSTPPPPCKRSASKYTRFTVPHTIQSSTVQSASCSVLGEKSYTVIYNTGMSSAVRAHIYYTILMQCSHSMYPYYQSGLVVHYTCTLTDSWCDMCVTGVTCALCRPEWSNPKQLIRPLIFVVIKSYRECKLTQQMRQSNEGGLLHTVK